MSKIIKVSYNADTLKTAIVVDGKDFDTSRINGKEIADWAYPFMVRKMRWDGFYDEMVAALGGEKAFDLVFEGSDEALAELKEAWEDAPVNVVSGEQGNKVSIIYDADARTTEITVNGQPFDTSRINDKEIEDWVYPFMMRKVKWDGIFDELKAALGTEDYEIQFSGTRAAMKVLMEECPENVTISYQKSDKPTSDKKEIKAHTIPSNPKKEEDAKSTIQRLLDTIFDDYENTSEQTKKDVFYQLKKLADDGNAFAQAELSGFYRCGIGTSVNMDKCFFYAEKSASQNYPDGLESLGDCFLYGHGTEENQFKAFECYQRAAEFGSATGYIQMAKMYKEWYLNDDWFESTGMSVEDAEAEAIRLYRQVMETTTADEYAIAAALTALAEMDSNSNDAVKYLEKAANIGNITAQIMLGVRYLKGDGVPSDERKAYQMFSKATKSGDMRAQRNLGICYYCGYGVQPDVNEAAKLFLSAAIQGDVPSEYLLAICYETGQGVPQDYREANKWYQKAMDDGDVEAKTNYALNIMSGTGITQNYDYGVQLLEEAASEGSEFAQEVLSELERQRQAKIEENKNTIKLGLKLGTGALSIISNVTGNPVFAIAGAAFEKVGNSAIDGDFSSAWNSAKEGVTKLLTDDEEE